jgi:hypothetical protein
MKRSDTDIRRDVEAELQWDPSIDYRKTGSTQLNRKRYPAMELQEAITPPRFIGSIETARAKRRSRLAGPNHGPL